MWIEAWPSTARQSSGGGGGGEGGGEGGSHRRMRRQPIHKHPSIDVPLRTKTLRMFKNILFMVVTNHMYSSCQRVQRSSLYILKVKFLPIVFGPRRKTARSDSGAKHGAFLHYSKNLSPFWGMKGKQVKSVIWLFLKIKMNTRNQWRSQTL